MRHMLLAIFSTFCLSLSGQITVTNATFPKAGDTLFTARDAQPNLVDAITPPGGGQKWDFSSLEPEDELTTVYQSASAGVNSASFPGAELMVPGQNNETYYNVTNTKIEYLGYAGADPSTLGLNITAKFSPPLVARRAPMIFFDINQTSTNLSLPFSIEDLPDSLINNIPGLSFADSIRIRISTQRLEVVDGWGTVKIPGGEYPVLREKRTEYSTTNMDVYIGSPFPLGWVDISSLGGGGGGGFGNFLGTDTTVTHNFFSATEKEIIASLRLNNDQSTIASATFKYRPTSSGTEEENPDAPGNATIAAFPNPAIEWVRFDCSNLPASDYTLKIFNIVGKVVWKETFSGGGNRSIRLELDSFKKGAYLYSLADKKGNVIGTRRLVILKP